MSVTKSYVDGLFIQDAMTYQQMAQIMGLKDVNDLYIQNRMFKDRKNDFAEYTAHWKVKIRAFKQFWGGVALYTTAMLIGHLIALAVN